MGQPRSRWATSAKNKQASRNKAIPQPWLRYGQEPASAPLAATELTADTCCALGVHSQWCGCHD